MNKAYEIERHAYAGSRILETQRVNLTAPFGWLKQGIQDFIATPVLSIIYGLVFASLGLGVSYAAGVQPKLTLTFMVGLLIIGPFLATGLYQVAKRKKQNRSISLRNSLQAITRHKGRIAVFVLLMLLLTVAWIRLSSLIVAVYYGQLLPDVTNLANMLGSAQAPAFVTPLMITAVLFGFLLFAASALSLPMVIDRRAEMIPALVTSLKSVTQQPGPMLIWAGIIASLTLLGMATMFIGLVFVFPILGYATWHSYRELIRH